MPRTILYLCSAPDPTSAAERQRLMYNLVVAHPYLLTEDLLHQVEDAEPEPLYESPPPQRFIFQPHLSPSR